MNKENQIKHDKILSVREDLSDYVFHFTRYPEDQGKETLKSILSDNAILDKGKKGYLCFTEAPITQLPAMFELFEKDPSFHPNYRYAPYGIGVRKDYFYGVGGRPIILSNNEEIARIEHTYANSTPEDIQFYNEHLKWRLQALVPGVYDFAWLREWRIPVERLELSYENCIAVVPTGNEHKDLLLSPNDAEFYDAEPEDGGHFSYATFQVTYDRILRGVNIKQLGEIITGGMVTGKIPPTKEMLNKDISLQSQQEICFESCIMEI